MSTIIHNAILMSGQRWHIICTDGLNTNVVSHLKNILNFGGDIRFENCGAQNEW